jgi:hypothetical protein
LKIVKNERGAIMSEHDQKLLTDILANKERYLVVVDNDNISVYDKNDTEHAESRSFESFGQELILHIFKFWGVEAEMA